MVSPAILGTDNTSLCRDFLERGLRRQAVVTLGDDETDRSPD